jgi:uncharacterized protein YneF (UPF0154 family)
VIAVTTAVLGLLIMSGLLIFLGGIVCGCYIAAEYEQRQADERHRMKVAAYRLQTGRGVERRSW